VGPSRRDPAGLVLSRVVSTTRCGASGASYRQPTTPRPDPGARARACDVRSRPRGDCAVAASVPDRTTEGHVRRVSPHVDHTSVSVSGCSRISHSRVTSPRMSRHRPAMVKYGPPPEGRMTEISTGSEYEAPGARSCGFSKRCSVFGAAPFPVVPCRTCSLRSLAKACPTFEMTTALDFTFRSSGRSLMVMSADPARRSAARPERTSSSLRPSSKASIRSADSA